MPSSPRHPPPSLAGAPWLVRAETQAVFAALAAAGHPARAIGGAVRDALIGRPVSDVDIATPALPHEIVGASEAAGLATAPTGILHGTVTVISSGTAYEVTTLRRDVATDGRRATVAFTDDWLADAERRDFTMNALSCDPDGTVHDPVGGWPDLARRRVRFIGDPDSRIAEDYLRILRFFRFHAEIGEGAADREALAASIRGRNGLAHLSAERIRAEMLRLLVARRAVEAIGDMTDCGLLPSVTGAAPRPGVLAALAGAEAALGLPPDAMLRLSALAVAVADDTGRLAARWRLSNAERDALCVVGPGLAGQVAGLDATGQRQRLYQLGAARWQRSCVALAALQPGEIATARELLALAATWKWPVLPVGGTDVIARGVPPGPQVGRLLRDLESWWVDNDFPDARTVHDRLDAIVKKRTNP